MACRHDEQSILRGNVVNRVLEDGRETAADVGLDDAPALRIGENPLDDFLHHVAVADAKSMPLRGLITDVVREFSPGCGMKDDPHSPKMRRVSANTSSPGMP